MPYSPEMLRAAREMYRYVPARLVEAGGKEPRFEWAAEDIHLRLVPDCPAQRQWNDSNFRVRCSSVALDDFHEGLLNGAVESDLLHGLASSVFWGFASGSDGIIRVERALGKARCLAVGRGGPVSSRRIGPQRAKETISLISQARDLLAQGDMGAALACAMNIQFLGMSFASKLLMFMRPSAAVVFDSVIARSLEHAPSNSLRAIASEAKRYSQLSRGRAYSSWCEYCSETAFKMSRLGDDFEWTDWNGLRQVWRAVDIERAIFALAAKQNLA